MTDNENVTYETESELLQIVSENASRDLRRYPTRFNTDNE